MPSRARPQQQPLVHTLLIILVLMGAGASKAPPGVADSGVTLPPGVDKLGAGLLLCRRRRPATTATAAKNDNGDVEVLLLKRRSKHHGGTWGLPGGNAEPGDASLLATAVREAAEEMGAAGAPPFVVQARLDTRRGKRGQKLYAVFVATVDEADAAAYRPVLNEEHTDFRWFGSRDVDALVGPALAAMTGGGGEGSGGGEEDELHPVVALAMREAGGAAGLGRLVVAEES